MAVLCQGCGDGGSMAGIALAQASRLVADAQVTLLSDTLPAELPTAVRAVRLEPRRFGVLRRLAHVPSAIALGRHAAAALARLHAMRPLHLVLCHSHPLLTLAALPLRRRHGVACGLVPPGDVSYRPRGTYDPLLTRFYRWATPRAYAAADVVLAPSPAMAARARTHGARPERVALVPWGVDPAEIGLRAASAPPEASGPGSGPLRGLFVGRLAVEKGVDVLLAACARLRSRGVPFTLRLIGTGPRAESLAALARRLQVDTVVSWDGPVPRHELGPRYAAADLLCLPSLDEPFGLVAVESLLSGTPVVGSDTGGIPFIVRHGHDGRLVPPGSADALARALESLHADRTHLQALRREASRSVRSRFSWESAHRALLEALRPLLALPPGPQP